MPLTHVGTIDACVHPQGRRADELREYMPDPWRSRPFPGPHRFLYPAPTGDPPFGEFLPRSRPADGLPGSDPAFVSEQLSELDIGRAILLPLTRGLLADIDLGSAICSATNDWLAKNWLEGPQSDPRFLGSIRVNPADPEGAVTEIERWAGHPKMVQIAVPMEAHRPYGQRNYSKIWESAARLGLPVAVHSDGGAGVDFWPTPAGYPRHYIEYSTLASVNFFYHLSSLIAEGVFERMPRLRFVFADGGHDLLMPLMWRMDMDWPMVRSETPWVTKRPSEYLASHVRFCTSRLEGPRDGRQLAEWLTASEAGELLMFASNYPHWTTMSPSDLLTGAESEGRHRLLAGNAMDFYGLAV
jgi:predicted TIM-barrel fold metal-dependent hydrolase